ncbi:MAG: threonine dehydratase [Planctomycetes bacterium]|nr:threonine dehydratase [Planctomycetota bacterium]
MTTASRPTKSDIDRACQALEGIVQETPLLPFADADDLWLKPEVFQPAGSFKVRGVYHAVARMSTERRAAGVSTVSAGNTAKALAWAARQFGVEARSLMPDSAPRSKVEAMRALGGMPILVPVADVFAYLKEHRWEDEPWAFVHPWTSRDVMTGHGTMGLEIVAALPEVDTVYIPVGGGGLLGGVGSALKAAKPSLRVVAVEPEGCPSLHAAIAAGHPVDVDCETICDGVAVPYITEEMFPLLSDLADEVVLVSEDDVKQTIRCLATRAHLVAEGAGALATAAALRTPVADRGRTVCIITGGSIDADKLGMILQ